MKYYSITLKKIAVILVMLVCVRSQAGINVYWDFDHTSYTVAPTDAIAVTATLFNDVSSDGHFLLDSVGATFAGDMQKLYNFTFGPPGENFANQFMNLSLAPGQSIHFVWGSLTPINGYVPPGTYGPDPAFLGFGGKPLYPGNSFQVVVVPEPSVVAIACLAGVWWLTAKPRERRR